jgi:hypothetical protein
MTTKRNNAIGMSISGEKNISVERGNWHQKKAGNVNIDRCLRLASLCATTLQTGFLRCFILV